ncbi:Glutathione S-transferase-O-methyltransferase fusion protein 14 [Zostera marina]|uniref:Glutathione S-transferase-O-methyltransferase fusion protein 14 n=1 Tax=Zostera marina TaxID=29655 RepID=A0A0K9PM30_ZOSMR|nr:Glutathione S-transferase-O-methyltransferase fusion protein 14 [Zostera marina]
MAKGIEDVKLIGFWASPHVLRGRIALGVKGVPYEFIDKDETFKIPKLLHAGRAICEPFNIVEYLDAIWNSVDFPPILSEDPYNRAIEKFWETHIDEKIASTLESMSNGMTEGVEEVFHSAILILESGLKNNDVGRDGKKFFGKENISYIDISLGSMLGWVNAIEKSRNLKLIDFEKTPMLMGWSKRFQNHGATKGLIPESIKLLSGTLGGKFIGGGSKEKEETEAYVYAMQLAIGSVLPMSLKVATELGVFDILANVDSKKFLSTKEIADKLSIENPSAPIMLDRILRCLSSHNILNCKLKSNGGTDEINIDTSRLYGASSVSRYFTKNEDGVSLRPLLCFVQDEVIMKTWYYIKDILMNGGIPFNLAYGMSSFNYMGKDMRFNKMFNDFAFNQTTIIMGRMLNLYNGFEDINTLVDVGGGSGASLNLIVSKHPTINGINFDLPYVIANAPLIKGVKHVGGDMLQNVPSGDAIFMKSVLHDWSDDHCVTILKNCWKQLSVKGKVIVAEFIIQTEQQQNNECKLMFSSDMMMFLLNQGGKERTEEEFYLLGKKAGFTSFRIASSLGGFYVMEFTK